MSGIASRKAVERAMHSVSIVEKNISDCNFDFHTMGKPAHFITNPVLECTDMGSSAHDLSKLSANLVSANISNPLLKSGTHVRNSSSVPRNYFPIRLIAAS